MSTSQFSGKPSGPLEPRAVFIACIEGVQVSQHTCRLRDSTRVETRSLSMLPTLATISSLGPDLKSSATRPM